MAMQIMALSRFVVQMKFMEMVTVVQIMAPIMVFPCIHRGIALFVHKILILRQLSYLKLCPKFHLVWLDVLALQERCVREKHSGPWF